MRILVVILLSHISFGLYAQALPFAGPKTDGEAIVKEGKDLLQDYQEFQDKSFLSKLKNNPTLLNSDMVEAFICKDFEVHGLTNRNVDLLEVIVPLMKSSNKEVSESASTIYESFLDGTIASQSSLKKLPVEQQKRVLTLVERHGTKPIDTYDKQAFEVFVKSVRAYGNLFTEASLDVKLKVTPPAQYSAKAREQLQPYLNDPSRSVRLQATRAYLSTNLSDVEALEFLNDGDFADKMPELISEARVIYKKVLKTFATDPDEIKKLTPSKQRKIFDYVTKLLENEIPVLKKTREGYDLYDDYRKFYVGLDPAARLKAKTISDAPFAAAKIPAAVKGPCLGNLLKKVFGG